MMGRQSKFRRHTRRAFTLIELLLVLVILAVLAGVVVPQLVGYGDKAKRGRTIADIANLKTVLQRFELENSRLPSEAEGLSALVEQPADLTETWKQPYVEKMPVDGWGNAYTYSVDDATGFNIISAGKDGQFGTDDDIDKYTDK